MSRKYPKLVITDEGATYQEKGQLWLYRNNLACSDEPFENGEPVDVVRMNGTYLGTGLLSKKSHVVVRILSRNPEEVIDEAFFRRRIEEAYAFRKTVEADNLTNCRLIYGEADLLPGLLIDRYNDILVAQVSSYGMEMRKDMLYRIVLDVLKQDGQDVKAVYERNDIAVRTKEGLEENTGFYGDVTLPTETIINENGLLLKVDIANGQKTGYFLDQKSNRVLLRKVAKGKKVLDCFTHTGGFALNAAYGGASEVVAVDVSETALEEGRANAKLNHLEDRVRFVRADVFDYLDTCADEHFDLIVLDPPAFTKSRRTVNNAFNGYKRINRQAMEQLKKNHGYLVTCSCSRFMETENFEKMLREAAIEAGVLLKQISVTQQNADHPILWPMDETSYLKFYMFQVIERF